jgi:hypothetical protein
MIFASWVTLAFVFMRADVTRGNFFFHARAAILEIFAAKCALCRNAAQIGNRSNTEALATVRKPMKTHPRNLPTLWLFEIALVLVRLDHVASGIINPNHSIV